MDADVEQSFGACCRLAATAPIQNGSCDISFVTLLHSTVATTGNLNKHTLAGIWGRTVERGFWDQSGDIASVMLRGEGAGGDKYKSILPYGMSAVMDGDVDLFIIIARSWSLWKEEDWRDEEWGGRRVSQY